MAVLTKEVHPALAHHLNMGNQPSRSGMKSRFPPGGYVESGACSCEIVQKPIGPFISLLDVLLLCAVISGIYPPLAFSDSFLSDASGVLFENSRFGRSGNDLATRRYAALEPSASAAPGDTTPGSESASSVEKVERLNREVVGLYRQGDYERALARALDACELSRRTRGEEHPEHAASLDNLAAIYKALGRYGEAEPLLRQALDIRKKVLGENDPDYVISLNNLAGLYRATGRYAEAEPLYLFSLEIVRTGAGEENPFFATCLNNLASLYKAMGDYAAVEPLYTRARDIVFKISGENSADYAVILSNLAQYYGLAGRSSEAESTYRRSLEITRNVLGEQHPQYARTLNNLASLYETGGNFARAEPLYQQAMEILQSKTGKGSPDYASASSNLAGLYKSIGDHARAETLYREANEIRLASLGENHPDFASGLGNLADLYFLKGDFKNAEPLYERALEIERRNLGENHPDVALDMQNLAVVYKAAGKFEKSEELYRRALEISKSAMGDRHPNVALTLHNLAALRHAMGRYQEAEPLYLQALEIRSAALGEDHPDVAAVLNNLAALLAATSRESEALQLMKRAQSINDRSIANVFAMASESRRLGYLAILRGEMNAFLSLIAGPLAGSREAVEDGLDLVLRRKAIVADAMAAERDAVLSGRYPDLEPKLREMKTLRVQIAQKMMAGPGPEGIDAHRRLLEKWNVEKEKIETLLASRIPEVDLRKRLMEADRRAVAAALPAGAALVEYVRYNVFDFRASAAKGQLSWKPPRYLAFVLSAGEPSTAAMIDLGEADAIDRLVSDFRSTVTGESEKRDGRGIATKSEGTAPTRSGADLRAMVFDPLLKVLGERKQLFLAPDGELYRLSFAALPLNAGRCLIDEHPISYVGAGRDVLRFGVAPLAEPSAALVVADPDYDLEAAAQLPQPDEAPAGRRSRDLFRNIQHFQRLPGTRLEGERVAAMLGVSPVEGSRASKGEIKGVRSPRILHMATHGFFLPDQDRSRGGGTLQGAHGAVPHDPGASRFETLKETPLLRSGIVLAGANAWLQGRRLSPENGDGFLTGEDASGLDLLSTDLVVLSACETGLGDIKSGEGVFGLRRAFILAGAKTLLMSLWKVPDSQTQMLMVEFYGLVLQGRPRADALREAQLTVKRVFPEPFYWAAFICQGDPGALPSSKQND